MTTPPSDLRKVHMLLTYILSEFDRVCGQIGVDYALYGGSAIGAVRHGGFIPWDDDIDVFMLRPDYERFLREAPAHLSEGFRIDNQTSVPRYHLLFSKLGLTGTVFRSIRCPRTPSVSAPCAAKPGGGAACCSSRAFRPPVCPAWWHGSAHSFTR